MHTLSNRCFWTGVDVCHYFEHQDENVQLSGRVGRNEQNGFSTAINYRRHRESDENCIAPHNVEELS